MSKSLDHVYPCLRVAEVLHSNKRSNTSISSYFLLFLTAAIIVIINRGHGLIVSPCQLD
jgi:hypothetical protein